jgi:hypothetical protein
MSFAGSLITLKPLGSHLGSWRILGAVGIVRGEVFHVRL